MSKLLILKATIVKKLGSGSFGTVYKAMIKMANFILLESKQR